MMQVIALGGNALIQRGERGTVKQLSQRIKKSVRTITKICEGHHTLIVPGSGPSIGALLLQNKLSRNVIPEMPLDVLDAEIQGQLGYLLTRELSPLLKHKVVSLLTQVVVSAQDPAFHHPTKFIGPCYQKKKKGMKKDTGGYRLVVPSPAPLEIIEERYIHYLLRKAAIVIAGVGGGIPVTRHRRTLKGVAAVVDKDAVASLLATKIGAQRFIIITDVAGVYLNFYQARRLLPSATRSELQTYAAAGHFPPGSMGPKITAALVYVRPGKSVIITNIKNLTKALRGKAGTVITS